MNARILVLTILSFCVASSATAQRVERKPIWYKDFNGGGALKNAACTPQGDVISGSSTMSGAVLHRGAASGGAYLTIAGRAITSCIEATFQPTRATTLNVTYRPMHNAVPSCSDGGTNVPPDANTGGEVEIFVSNSSTSDDQGASWQTVKDTAGGVVVLGRAQTSVSIALRPDAGVIRSVLLCRNAGADTRDDVIIDSVSIDHGKSATASDPKRLALQTFWNKAYDLRGDYLNQVAPYQTPAVYALMSGWLIERNNYWKTAVIDQIAYSKSRRYFGGYPYTPSDTQTQTILRDQVAREAIAQYHAADMFYDTHPELLTGTSGVKSLLTKMIALKQQTVKIKVGTQIVDQELMHPAYSASISNGVLTTTPSSTPNCRVSKIGDVNIPTVDCESVSPNQNAEVGLFYTLAYHDPRLSPTNTEEEIANKQRLKNLAMGELLAAISLQVGPTSPGTPGALGLAYGSECLYDTNYGALTLQLVALANMYWKDARLENAIRLGGQWLSAYEGEGSWAYLIANGETCGPRPTIPPGGPEACKIPESRVKTGQCETGQEMWNRVTALRAFTGSSIKSKTTYYNNMFNASRWLNEVNHDGRIVFYMNSGMAFTDYFPGAN